MASSAADASLKELTSPVYNECLQSHNLLTFKLVKTGKLHFIWKWDNFFPKKKQPNSHPHIPVAILFILLLPQKDIK